ncbi:MAG: hypothetical protein D8M58_18615 [Calditrichaeota bacterium]|nr:MAG: hypothetical protein DWQ03_11845 [Calditrichota bacterium]MBL1207423.1 hypothetical protein [Calditrichota bacterium]NOG47255.1 hypothetical protein [Calditrichota bacterium]
MHKPTFYVLTIIFFSSLLFFACENSAEPKEEEKSDFNSALIQSFDDEIKLVQNGSKDLEGDAMFSLSWGKLKAPFLDLEFEMGNAMAVAFDEKETKRGYFHFGGLDMGDVLLEMPSDTLHLNGINGRGGSYIYISAPKIEGRGRHGFDSFNFSMVPFDANSDYIFKTSGSDDIEAMTVSFKTPQALLSISNLEEGQAINPSEDLVIDWQGAAAESKILIALLPFHNPNGRGKDRLKLRDLKDNPDFVRLDFENHPVIIEMMDDNNGTFTIPAEKLSELVESVDAKSLLLHIAAIDFTSEEINSKLINKLIRMNDKTVLVIE